MKPLHICCLIPQPSTTNPYWGHFEEGFHKSLKKFGAEDVKLSVRHFDASSKSSLLRCWNEIKYLPLDGLVVAPLHYQVQRDQLQSLAKKNIPFVFIDTEVKEAGALAYIGQPAHDSGKVAAELASLSMQDHQSLLVVNMGNIINDNILNLRYREEGIRAFWKQHHPERKLHKIAYSDGDDVQLKTDLQRIFEEDESIGSVIMPNSRAYKVAETLTSLSIDIPVIGYDPTAPNVEALETGTIKFLIGQQASHQGERAVAKIVDYLKGTDTTSGAEYVKIDIITQTNFAYYFSSTPFVQS